MAWFTRFTRFGDVHLVYGQEAGKSCGIASVMMCIFKINKLVPGRTSVTIEKDICQAFETASGMKQGQKYQPEQSGTRPEPLAIVLNRFTEGNWSWHKTPPSSVPQVLVDNVGVTTGLGPIVNVNPLILGVDWDLGGAHWVVVDTVRSFMGSNYATICDPWDANVHIQKFNVGSPFFYDAGSGGFMIDAWGESIAKKRKRQYDNTDKGKVKAWGMIYRD